MPAALGIRFSIRDGQHERASASSCQCACSRLSAHFGALSLSSISSQEEFRVCLRLFCEAVGSMPDCPVFLRTIPGMAEKGAEAYDNTTRNFLPLAWMSLGKHSVHATTKTSDTSSVVQMPMKRPFQETSASAIGADMARVNQMRMAEAIQALSFLLVFCLSQLLFDLHQSGCKQHRNEHLARQRYVQLPKGQSR